MLLFYRGGKSGPQDGCDLLRGTAGQGRASRSRGKGSGLTDMLVMEYHHPLYMAVPSAQGAEASSQEGRRAD